MSGGKLLQAEKGDYGKEEGKLKKEAKFFNGFKRIPKLRPKILLLRWFPITWREVLNKGVNRWLY